MAVSAFRSTTKRSCQIGAAEASVPSTPRSRAEPPPRKGSHRRSSSMTDFSPKYFSDCSATSEYRAYNANNGKRGGRSSVCPSDSESDMEGVHGRRRYRQRDAESEDEKGSAPPVAVINAYHQRRNLRRTSSHQDLSRHESNSSHGALIPYNDFRGDDPEELVEEKTIRAVYAQIKSLRTDPPTGDFGAMDFLDAMRAEVRRAVAEIRTELEESMEKNCKSTETSEGGSLQESKGTDVIQAVADIRKEYSTKLEQSEKRVRELWSQLAVEERRCLELAKIVKELLPTPHSSEPHSSVPYTSSNRRRSHKRRNSAEKQSVSKSLEDEALKFFEESVSISALDCPADSDDSCREIDHHSKSTKDASFEQNLANGGETIVKALDEEAAKDMTDSSEGNRQSKGRLVGNDGVVLPWLQWEAEPGVSDKNLKKVGKRHLSPKGSSSSNTALSRTSNGSNSLFFSSSSNGRLNTVRKPTLSGQGSTNVGHVSHTTPKKDSVGGRTDILSCKKVANSSESASQASSSARTSLFTIADNRVRKDQCFPDSDTLMLERIRFRHRIESGELILCQGLSL